MIRLEDLNELVNLREKESAALEKEGKNGIDEFVRRYNIDPDAFHEFLEENVMRIYLAAIVTDYDTDLVPDVAYLAGFLIGIEFHKKYGGKNGN